MQHNVVFDPQISQDLMGHSNDPEQVLETLQEIAQMLWASFETPPANVNQHEFTKKFINSVIN